MGSKEVTKRNRAVRAKVKNDLKNGSVLIYKRPNGASRVIWYDKGVGKFLYSGECNHIEEIEITMRVIRYMDLEDKEFAEDPLKVTTYTGRVTRGYYCSNGKKCMLLNEVGVWEKHPRWAIEKQVWNIKWK